MIPLRDDNPTRSTPVVTILLIVANVAVFLLQQVGGNAFTYRFALFPEAVTQGTPVVLNGQPWNLEPAWLTILTSMFLHGSWLHLGGNMLYLWIFGNNVEDTLGKVRYIIFYLVGGAAAAALHIVTGPRSEVPTVGASGAIAAVLGGYILLFPHARITTLVPIFIIMQLMELPAKLVLGFWFLLQLFNGFMGLGAQIGGGPDRGGVAFMAHVGGFIAGYLLIRLMGGRRREPTHRDRPRFMDDF